MVKQWIIQWFKDNSKVLGEIDIEANYIDSEIIDSIGFVTLISECEEQFDIVFDDQDFENPEIFTIIGLINLIEMKK